MQELLSHSGFLVGMVLFTSGALAQEPISDNDFVIDAFEGPVLGSSRYVGLGGAATAIADGIAGAHWNPACYASRYLFEFDWWEWDVSLSYFSPGVFGQTDLFNNGNRLKTRSFHFANAGLRFQFGRLGLGLDFRAKVFQMPAAGTDVEIELLEGHTGLGWAFAEGQLVLGLGVRGADLFVRTEGQDLVHFRGASPEVGALLRLEGKPWRVGIAGRLPVESSIEEAKGVIETNGVKSAAGFVLPSKVSMPWEVQLGFAWQLFGRPLNQRWQEPREVDEELEARLELLRCRRRLEQLKAEAAAEGKKLPPARRCPAELERPKNEAWWEGEWRLRRAEKDTLEQAIEQEEERIYWARRRGYERLERWYLLFTADLLVTGSTAKGVGLDAFLQQQLRPAGERASVAFRLGAECEPLGDWLKTRAGFYLEPGRGRGASLRPHGTFGTEVRLFGWDFFGLVHPFTFSLSLTGDVAPRYVDLGLSIGFWH